MMALRGRSQYKIKVAKSLSETFYFLFHFLRFCMFWRNLHMAYNQADPSFRNISWSTIGMPQSWLIIIEEIESCKILFISTVSTRGISVNTSLRIIWNEFEYPYSEVSPTFSSFFLEKIDIHKKNLSFTWGDFWFQFFSRTLWWLHSFSLWSISINTKYCWKNMLCVKHE